MRHQSLRYYCSLKILSKFSFDYSFYTCNVYSDTILHLTNPKLIIDLKINNLQSINSVNKELLQVNQNNISSNLSNKSDKKYKIDTNSDTSIDIKKNKIKATKKNRKHVPLDKDDIFIENNSNFFNNSSVDLSLIKKHKFNKNKKKNKNKVNSINTISLVHNTNLSSINKDVIINNPLSIQELSYKLNIPEAEIITYLFLKGIPATINQVIDISIAREVALNYDFNVLNEDKIDKVQTTNLNHSIKLKNDFKRAPIVTIFGHVDHGKTTLLDCILTTDFVNKEYGGITQSIAGYEVNWLYDSFLYKLIFLDTPGHEAFKAMRIRGAQVTDIALLVIAADDGLRPQSIEAINYIIEMQLSYIVVINKIDKEDINVNKIKEELSKYNILSEEWGGNAIIVEVSATKQKNIDLLLSNICLLSQIKNLTANPDQLSEGTILESYLDKRRGVIAHIIVQNGTLKIGDFIVAGDTYGKVKNIMNTNNIQIKSSGPSSVVQVLGFTILPESGTIFQCVTNEKDAKQCINNIPIHQKILNKALKSLNKRVTLDNNNTVKQLSLIIKTDSLGSLEALLNAFSKISQKKVQINIITANFGNISNKDINLALTTNSLILGFNIDITSDISHLIKKNNIVLKTFNVIYDLLKYLENYMLDLIELEYKRVFIGRAIVQTVFSINKGFVAGCFVDEGKLKKNALIIVYRNENIVYEGLLKSLKRLKENVDDVDANNECGIMCDYDSWENSDMIKAYDLVPEAKSL
uniref:Translation initiation factor IF-2, chloroplastic n=1 Tax=Acrosorium ciliolatum TaxID=1550622 RepID=A0A1Z1M2H2_9FLOR|nr:translation initiation factor 2 [Acrosorium ciliolatum]ARW60003.1 translation initiation factor 2 [Acrosorium ciliolatum]